MNSPWIVRILCGCDEDYCLAVRSDKVVTTVIDNRDKLQYWIKDEKQSSENEGGRRSSLFTLVNHATGLAIRDSAANNMLYLVHYDFKHEATDSLDKKERAAVWTVEDMDKRGFHCICKANNTSHMITVEAVKHSQEGRYGCLSQGRSDNFLWKIVPVRDTMQISPIPNTTLLGRPVPTQKKTVKIYCAHLAGHNMTILNDTVILAPSDPEDKYQYWFKETAYAQHVKDGYNRKAFALVNKATGKAISHGLGLTHLVKLVQFNPRYLDPTILWTEATTYHSEGFCQIIMLTNSSACLNAFIRPQMDTSLLVGVWKSEIGANCLWKIADFEKRDKKIED